MPRTVLDPPVGRSARKPEYPFAQHVAEYLCRAAHDRVRGGVAERACRTRAETMRCAPQQGVRTEHPRAERREALFELGAERLRRGREAGRGLLERLPEDEQPADAIARLDRGELLAHDRIGAVDEPGRHQVAI